MRSLPICLREVGPCRSVSVLDAAGARTTRGQAFALTASEPTTADATPSAGSQDAPPPPGSGSGSLPSTVTATPAGGAGKAEPGTRSPFTWIQHCAATTGAQRSMTSRRCVGLVMGRSTLLELMAIARDPVFLDAIPALPRSGSRERNPARERTSPKNGLPAGTSARRAAP